MLYFAQFQLTRPTFNESPLNCGCTEFYVGVPGGASGKEPACQCRRYEMWVRSLCGRPPGEGHGNPLRYSCLKNPTDRGAWRATVHGAAKSWTRQKQVSTHVLSWVTINCPIWQFNVWHIVFYLPLNWSSLNLLNMTEHSVGLLGRRSLKLTL